MAQLKSTIVQGALTVTGNVVANKLIKVGGTSDQILMADGSTSNKSDITALINAAVTIKGTLGTGGTITSLPTASASNLGYGYKVITAGTYNGVAAKIGDMFICYKNGSSYAWMHIPSGDDIEDTWRPVQVNGTQILANGNTTGAINLKAGTNVSISNSSGTVTFAATDTGATSVEVTGAGNAVTAASYDASTRKLTLTKGTTFLTSHQSLANYVTLNGNQTITGIKTFSTHIKTAENTMGIKLRTHDNYETGWVYGTTGNEAVTLAIQNPVTAFQIVYGTKPSAFAGGTWQTVTPLFQTKDGKVIINRKITATADTTNLKLLDVNGEMAATTIYENGTSLANKYAAKDHNHDGTYLKSEADTLQSVTNRGATTTKAITALSYSVNSAVTMEYDSSYKALKFVFA